LGFLRLACGHNKNFKANFKLINLFTLTDKNANKLFLIDIFLKMSARASHQIKNEILIL
jgi:hypothetical protein